MYVEEQEQIPWDTLNVMVADITYGVSQYGHDMSMGMPMSTGMI